MWGVQATGKTLVASGADGTVRFWDIETTQPLHVINLVSWVALTVQDRRNMTTRNTRSLESPHFSRRTGNARIVVRCWDATSTAIALDVVGFDTRCEPQEMRRSTEHGKSSTVLRVRCLFDQQYFATPKDHVSRLPPPTGDYRIFNDTQTNHSTCL